MKYEGKCHIYVETFQMGHGLWLYTTYYIVMWYFLISPQSAVWISKLCRPSSPFLSPFLSLSLFFLSLPLPLSQSLSIISHATSEMQQQQIIHILDVASPDCLCLMNREAAT